MLTDWLRTGQINKNMILALIVRLQTLLCFYILMSLASTLRGFAQILFL